MEFKGDIIITDPCYIINENNTDDWSKCKFGANMQAIGIKKSIVKSTEFGDWSCKTLSDKGDILGEFCADAGLVGVFLLDEILAYNPKFDLHTTKKWTTTLIKGFEGEIKIKHRGTKENKYVSVIGKGNINFYTSQNWL